jgi:hypothetical protein
MANVIYHFRIYYQLITNTNIYLIAFICGNIFSTNYEKNRSIFYCPAVNSFILSEYGEGYLLNTGTCTRSKVQLPHELEFDF